MQTETTKQVLLTSSLYIALFWMARTTGIVSKALDNYEPFIIESLPARRASTFTAMQSFTMILIPRLLLSVSLMTAGIRASESRIDEVIHAPRDGQIVLDGRPVIYIVIDAGQPEATYMKEIFCDIYSHKSFRRIYFRTKLNLAEINDVKPTSIWLFGSFASNIANVGDVPVAAYAALPAAEPPARTVAFPVGLLLVKGSELTPRWRNWSRPTPSVVLFMGGESGSVKSCIGELISKTEERAMQLHR